jgi:hypothetical protein
MPEVSVAEEETDTGPDIDSTIEVVSRTWTEYDGTITYKNGRTEPVTWIEKKATDDGTVLLYEFDGIGTKQFAYGTETITVTQEFDKQLSPSEYRDIEKDHSTTYKAYAIRVEIGIPYRHSDSIDNVQYSTLLDIRWAEEYAIERPSIPETVPELYQ